MSEDITITKDNVLNEGIGVIQEIMNLPEGKSAWDVFRSKRFITLLVFVFVTYFVIPFTTSAFPDWHLNAQLLTENTTAVVLAIITGYSAQDALRAIKGK